MSSVNDVSVPLVHRLTGNERVRAWIAATNCRASAVSDGAMLSVGLSCLDEIVTAADRVPEIKLAPTICASGYSDYSNQ